jgi:AraC family transcriptional regulator
MDGTLTMLQRIEMLPEKKLIGNRLQMSLLDNRTSELWKSFMERRKEIFSSVSTKLISMQVYGPSFDFGKFDPHAMFEKWAAVEVTDFDAVPHEMETYTLPGGFYAVFLHRGAASTGPKTFQYIFGTWLPNSGYLLDNRPHFEILGDKYKNDDPESEEEIWIPVRQK